jgi:glycopeptide antibiotics resistance protein
LYNTLIPFSFEHGLSDLQDLIHNFDFAVLDLDDISLTDIVGNILLFIPYGFLMFMFLQHRGIPHPVFITTVIGMGISFFIEVMQFFIASRDSAVHDIINNTLGSGIGAVAASFYSHQVAENSRKIFYDLLDRKPFLLLLVIIGMAQFITAIMPFTVSISVSDLLDSIKDSNIIPFNYQSMGALFLNHPNKLDQQPFDITIMMEDLIFWVAGGYILRLCYRLYWRKKPYRKLLMWGIPLVYFPFIEFVQIFITSRITDINDIISGLGGIVIGNFLYDLLRPVRRKNLNSDLDLLKIPLIIYWVFILFSGFRPLDWSFDPKVLAVDMRPDNLIPFYAYFRKTSLWNIYDVVNSLTYFLPISLFWSYRLKERGAPYVKIYLLTTITGLMAGALIEFTQLLSAARIAEITDVLAYGGSGAIGTFMIYYYENQVVPTLNLIRKNVLLLD